ncbi:hypothetical protein V8F33_010035 [Rhypophila sp. PSN 637]
MPVPVVSEGPYNEVPAASSATMKNRMAGVEKAFDNLDEFCKKLEWEINHYNGINRSTAEDLRLESTKEREVFTRVHLTEQGLLESYRKLKEAMEALKLCDSQETLEHQTRDALALQARRVPELEAALSDATKQIEDLQSALTGRDTTIRQLKDEAQTKQGEWTRLKARHKTALDQATDATIAAWAAERDLESERLQVRNFRRELDMAAASRDAAARAHESQLKEERINALRDAREEEARRRPPSPTEMLNRHGSAARGFWGSH